MWPQEPGSFTRIIAAMVAPRKTSSETMRAGRAGLTAGMEFDAGATIVSAVAMGRPSNGGDSTAARIMPQRRNGEHAHKKTWPGGGIPAMPFARGKKLSRLPFTGCASGAGPPRRTARPILVISQIVRAAEHGTDEAGALRDPPHVTHPRVPAVHHFPAREIHQYRPDLNGCVQRSVAGERPQ